jgi:hypothetical protein
LDLILVSQVALTFLATILSAKALEIQQHILALHAEKPFLHEKK